MDRSIFWWCLSIRGGKGVLGMVLWCSGILLIAFYDGYLGAIDGFCSTDFIGGNWKVYDLVLFDGFFYGLCIRPSYKLL